MTAAWAAFWVAVVVGIVVSVAYITLGVQAFFRVRKDVLALAASGQTADLDTAALESNDAGSFSWKALGAVVISTSVIALLGVSPVFWYLPAILAIGSAVAVIAAFLIDARSATGANEATGE
ncbi:MAG: rane protein [Mycobacterium sp.]|nr:rane protein [Mycobacterium sp.]